VLLVAYVFSFVVFVLDGQMRLCLLNKRHCVAEVAEQRGEDSPSVRTSNLEREIFSPSRPRCPPFST
jgi:hypothetical protein